MCVCVVCVCVSMYVCMCIYLNSLCFGSPSSVMAHSLSLAVHVMTCSRTTTFRLLLHSHVYIDLPTHDVSWLVSRRVRSRLTSSSLLSHLRGH